MKEKKSVCDICCEWTNSMEGKSPLAVRDSYPKVMRKVLKRKFGIPKKAADRFIDDACDGNWERLHETAMERHVSAYEYADLLIWEVFYCSDRWSFDRVLRVQWLYQRLKRHIETETRDC